MTVVLVISYHHYTAFFMVCGNSSSMITITMASWCDKDEKWISSFTIHKIFNNIHNPAPPCCKVRHDHARTVLSCFPSTGSSCDWRNSPKHPLHTSR